MHQPPGPSRRWLLVGSIIAGAACAAILLATSPLLPMVWDEGNAILRAEQLPQHWPYTIREEGHPAFYGIVIALGQRLAPAWLSPLDASRLGPMLLWALATGAMFYRMARDYSPVAGMGAAAALVLMPRVFAHAHFASLDGPLTSCWILAWATFAPALRAAPDQAGAMWLPRWTAVVLWGITLGMTLSCKATGWLAPLPFLAWAAAHRSRDRDAVGRPFQGVKNGLERPFYTPMFPCLRALAAGLSVALVAFFLLNPPLWHDPVQGWVTFFRLNLDRAAHPGLNISTQFFGRMYNLDYSLPWYNTLVWTAVAVPVGILLLGLIGVATVLRRWREDRAGMLLLANWLVLLVVRALPGTPPHDAERLILPSFAFLAALAGVGCHAVLRRAVPALTEKLPVAPTGLPARPKRPWHTTAVAALILLYAGSATSLFWYAPQWLSYYNLLIGGLPGATALGMEPTYYWDGLDRSVLGWLNGHTAADEKVCFAAAPAENLELMQRWGVLRPQTREDAPGEFRWYVVQHRPSGLQPEDVWLIMHCRPAFRKVIRPGGLGPWRLDVPLVEIYRYDQYVQAANHCGPFPSDGRITSGPTRLD